MIGEVQPSEPGGARVVIALGSNVGDRAGTLAKAAVGIAALLGAPVERSRLYETPALLPPDAPSDWDVAFLNAAVAGACSLPPLTLLRALQGLEADLGRQRRGHWGPREIDLDILVFGAQQIDAPSLTVPHAGLPARAFALAPLVDLWPDWHHPGLGLSAQTLLSDLLRQANDAPLSVVEDERWTSWASSM